MRRIMYSSEQGSQADREVQKNWEPLISLLTKDSFCKANSQLLIYLLCVQPLRCQYFFEQRTDLLRYLDISVQVESTSIPSIWKGQGQMFIYGALICSRNCARSGVWSTSSLITFHSPTVLWNTGDVHFPREETEASKGSSKPNSKRYSQNLNIARLKTMLFILMKPL